MGKYRLWHFVDQCTVTIQPAGSAGKRHVFLTIRDAVDGEQVELVLSETSAYQLGEALISGSVGVMREFDMPLNGRSSHSKRQSNQSDSK